MTEKQKKIATDLLEHLNLGDGFSSIDNCRRQISIKSHKPLDVFMTEKLLIEDGFINKSEEIDQFTLTSKGYKAVEMGFEGFCLAIEKRERDKEAKDHRDAVMSKWQIYIFWPMFIFATVGAVFGIIAFFWQLIK